MVALLEITSKYCMACPHHVVRMVPVLVPLRTRSGRLADRHAGILAYWYTGILAYWHTGIRAYWQVAGSVCVSSCKSQNDSLNSRIDPIRFNSIQYCVVNVNGTTSF